jgi:hypothetical protein
MHKLLLEIPPQIEGDRLHLRSYRAGDGQTYFAVSRKNRDHLAKYESDNVIMGIKSEEEAEVLVRNLAPTGSRATASFRENKRNPDGRLSGTLHFGLLKREYDALGHGTA